MKISGCIVTYNASDEIMPCIKSILEDTKNLDFKLYVVDNASSDDTVEVIRHEFPQVKVITNDKNVGFGKGHNKVIEYLDSDYHVVINPDIKTEDKVIYKLTTYLEEHKDVGQICPRVLNTDESEQHLPKRNPRFKYVILSKFPGFKKYRAEYTRQGEDMSVATEIEFASGCFFALPTSLYKELKGFDDRYYMYFEDADLSRRVAEHGKKIVYDPETYVYHDWHRDNMRSLKGAVRFLNSMCKYFMRWGA